PAFSSMLDPTGATLMYSTFLGGGSIDQALSLAVGPDGSAYVAGKTQSPDFPTTPGAFDTTYGYIQDAFLTKLDPQGAALTYSTFLGADSSTTSLDSDSA